MDGRAGYRGRGHAAGDGGVQERHDDVVEEEVRPSLRLGDDDPLVGGGRRGAGLDDREGGRRPGRRRYDGPRLLRRAVVVLFLPRDDDVRWLPPPSP